MELDDALTNAINGMVYGGDSVVVYTTSPVAGKEIIQWSTSQESITTQESDAARAVEAR